jgi:hypothetical protein
MSVRAFTLIGLGISLVLVLLVAPFSSPAPDGLEKIFQEYSTRLDRGHAEFPAVTLFPDYSTPGLAHPKASLAIAGIAGILLVFLGGFLLARSALGKPKTGSADAP